MSTRTNRTFSRASRFARAVAFLTVSAAMLVAVVALNVAALGASSAAAARAGDCAPELAYDNGGAIALYDIRTGRVWRLTHPDGRHFDSQPAWSPNGERVAFTREKTDSKGFFEDGTVFTVNADGSQLHRRARGYLTPAWSPDGRYLLMDTGGVRDSPPAVVGVDDNRPPHGFPISVFAATWTPDSRLGYPSWQPQGLFVINPDGSDSVKLATWSVRRLTIQNISWSPDGTHVLVYESSGSRYVIFDLLRHRFTQTIHQPGEAGRPVWSPDGRQLAYAHGRSVYVENLGPGYPQLLTGAPDPSGVEWSHDGRSIAYIATGSHGHDHVFIVPAVGGHPHELVRATQFDLRPCD